MSTNDDLERALLAALRATPGHVFEAERLPEVLGRPDVSAAELFRICAVRPEIFDVDVSSARVALAPDVSSTG